MSSSPQHQQEPTPVFLERMRKFDPADVRIVVTNLAAKLQPYLDGTDEAQRTVRSDLLRAHRQPCDIKQCYAALWRALPYITPDDPKRYSSLVTTSIWNFLIDQAQQLGYISHNPQRSTTPSTHQRRRFSLGWPWQRRSSTERKEADWAEDIGDAAGDYLASRSTAGHSGSGSSGGGWWDNWFGGSGSSGGGGGSWFDDWF